MVFNYRPDSFRSSIFFHLAPNIICTWRHISNRRFFLILEVTSLDNTKTNITIPWAVTSNKSIHLHCCTWFQCCDEEYPISMSNTHFHEGWYKTWTLDSGLDHGLDYGLHYGLDFGVSWTVNSVLELLFKERCIAQWVEDCPNIKKQNKKKKRICLQLLARLDGWFKPSLWQCSYSLSAQLVGKELQAYNT